MLYSLYLYIQITPPPPGPPGPPGLPIDNGIIALAIIGVLYGSLIAWRRNHKKRANNNIISNVSEYWNQFKQFCLK